MSNTPNPFNPPLVSDPVLQEQTNAFGFSWYTWFTKVARAIFAPASGTVPASSTSTGTPGQLAQGGGFLYVCVASNQWKRIPLSSF